ncbi:hypothetical protein [Cellulosilyticum ruminicola]|uniref:hypothetical protein n=1 Tax=Cellulosilyticum ruminicola TaxID=425254 RepID=UPI0012EE95A8|nr:hypothetical protein [Cellulosilyticum ruminicola]
MHIDATTISLPNQVADDYTGMGGRNLYQFYTLKRITLHTYKRLSNVIYRIRKAIFT